MRDAIVDELGDEDRRRLALLMGCMTDPSNEISARLADVLGSISRLSPGDRARLARWCGRYLTRWGQIPAASGRRVVPPPRRKP